MVTGQNYTKLKKNNNIQTYVDKRLSVQISLYGLSFLVTSRYGKDPVFFTEQTFTTAQTPEELLQHITASLETVPQLTEDFKEVVLLYHTNAYTLVPSSLFEANKASEYLKFNIKILATDYVAYEEANNTAITVVYIPFVNINNWFFEKFGSFKYFHGVTLLLEKILLTDKYSHTTNTYVNVGKNYVDLLVIKNGKLLLCNTFEFHTPEDFIYYILFVFEQLNLDPSSTPCILLGEIVEGDDLYNILYTYVKEVSFYKALNGIDIPVNGALPHQHVVLKNSL